MFPGASEFLRAFGDLSGDRLSGTTSFLAIDTWAKRNGVDDPDDFSVLVDMIASMDAAVATAPRPSATEARPLTPELFDAMF